jgi:hypothetical protein
MLAFICVCCTEPSWCILPMVDLGAVVEAQLAEWRWHGHSPATPRTTQATPGRVPRTLPGERRSAQDVQSLPIRGRPKPCHLPHTVHRLLDSLGHRTGFFYCPLAYGANVILELPLVYHRLCQALFVDHLVARRELEQYFLLYYLQALSWLLPLSSPCHATRSPLSLAYCAASRKDGEKPARRTHPADGVAGMGGSYADAGEEARRATQSRAPDVPGQFARSSTKA